MPLTSSKSADLLFFAGSGGGIGGLTLAIALGRYASPASSIEVDIYEADSEIRTVGAGITAWPRTWAMMRDLGLYEDLARIAVSEGSPGEIKDTLSEYCIYVQGNDDII